MQMKLVEECAGVGDLVRHGEVLRRVRYEINRYQGILPSGLPLPGKHRIEGRIDSETARDSSDLVGESLTLRLDDGRSMPITIADATGRVLAEGHGPRIGCACC
jgi:hypothetical protein